MKQIKYNQILIHDDGNISLSHNNEQGFRTNQLNVQSMLKVGTLFTDIIEATLSGENGNYGPYVVPSKKSLNRLNKIIRYTSFKVIKQIGQDVFLERQIN